MMATAYEKDIVAWSKEQAALLRAGRYSELDIEHLAEEIEDVGREQKFALQSLYWQILTHLLKLNYSLAQDSRAGWIEKIIEMRSQAQSRIEDTPGLSHYAEELLTRAWLQARRAIVKVLEIHDERVEIPEACPWSIEQVIDHGFLP